MTKKSAHCAPVPGYNGADVPHCTGVQWGTMQQILLHLIFI